MRPRFVAKTCHWESIRLSQLEGIFSLLWVHRTPTFPPNNEKLTWKNQEASKEVVSEVRSAEDPGTQERTPWGQDPLRMCVFKSHRLHLQEGWEWSTFWTDKLHVGSLQAVIQDVPKRSYPFPLRLPSPFHCQPPSWIISDLALWAPVASLREGDFARRRLQCPASLLLSPWALNTPLIDKLEARDRHTQLG